MKKINRVVITTDVICKVLDDLLEQTGLKWTNIAENSGIPDSTLSSIRSGGRRLTPEIASKLVSALGITVSQLYESLALEAVNREKQKFQQAHGGGIHLRDDAIDFVRTILSGLERGDMYFTISPCVSLEMGSPHALFVRSILAAVQRGTKFYYLYAKRPRDKIIQEADYLGPLLLASDILSFGTAFTSWKNSLKELSTETESLVENSIKGMSLDLEKFGFLFSPVSTYGIVRYKEATERNLPAFQAWQSASSGDDKLALLIELDARGSTFLDRVCAEIL